MKMKTVMQKDMCPMFIAALFTITKTQRQSKCPLMNKYVYYILFIHSCVYIYVHIYTYMFVYICIWIIL